MNLNYLLLQIEPSLNNTIEKIHRIIQDELNKQFQVAVVYPTHDKKCYIGLKSGSITDLHTYVVKNLLYSDSYTAKLVDPETCYVDKLSGYAYHHLKDHLFREIFRKFDMNYDPQSMQNYLKNIFGLDYVRVKMIDDDRAAPEYMVKLDGYQKRMLENALRSLADDVKESRSETNERSLSPTTTTSMKKSDSSSVKLPKNVFKFPHQITVEIFRGNLVKQSVDVIVNAANGRLILGGGVAGAISDACGAKVQDECKAYLNFHKIQDIPVTGVMHTKAYRIHAKYIIHAVGPRWWDYKDRNECISDLRETFINILDYLEKLDISRSVAIPLISSGVFGVPRHLCCKALYEAIQARPNCRTKQIKLVNIDAETNDALLDFFTTQHAMNAYNNNNNNNNSQIRDNQIGNEELNSIDDDYNHNNNNADRNNNYNYNDKSPQDLARSNSGQKISEQDYLSTRMEEKLDISRKSNELFDSRETAHGSSFKSTSDRNNNNNNNNSTSQIRSNIDYDDDHSRHDQFNNPSGRNNAASDDYVFPPQRQSSQSHATAQRLSESNKDSSNETEKDPYEDF